MSGINQPQYFPYYIEKDSLQLIAKQLSLYELARCAAINRVWFGFIDQFYRDDFISMSQLANPSPYLTLDRPISDKVIEALGPNFQLQWSKIEINFIRLIVNCQRLTPDGLAHLGENLPQTLNTLELSNVNSSNPLVMDDALHRGLTSIGEHLPKTLKTIVLTDSVFHGGVLSGLLHKLPQEIVRVYYAKRAVPPTTISFAGGAVLTDSRVFACRSLLHSGIESISLSACRKLTNATLTFLRQNLPEESMGKEVDLSGTEFSPHDLCTFLNTLPTGLQVLKLSATNTNGNVLEVIKRFKTLVHLEIAHCKNVNAEAISSLLPCLVLLSFLDLSGVLNSEDDCLNVLSSLPSSLATLIVAKNSGITEKVYQALAEMVVLKRLPSLERIDFTDCDFRNSPLNLIDLNLKDKTIFGSLFPTLPGNLDDQQLLALGSSLPNLLRSFSIVSHNVTKEGLMKLAKTIPTKIDFFGLACSSADDQVLEVFRNRLLNTNVTAIYLNAPKATDAGIAAFFQSKSDFLQTTILEQLNVSDEVGCLLFSRMSRVKNIIVKDCPQIGDKTFEMLLKLCIEKNVSDLWIENCSSVVGDQVAISGLLGGKLDRVNFSKCNNLSKDFINRLFAQPLRETIGLNFCETPLLDEHLSTLADHMPHQLKKLMIDDCHQITGNGIKTLIAKLPPNFECLSIKNCSGIQELDFSEGSHLSKSQLKAIFAHDWPASIRSVDFSQCQMDDELLELLLKNLGPNITAIRLNRCQLITANMLAKMTLPDSLKILELEETACNDSVAQSLFPRLPAGLRNLNLKGCMELTNITSLCRKKDPDSLQELNLENCNQIKRVSFRGMKLKNEALIRLLQSLPDKIEFLDLGGLDQITDKILQRLADRLPKGLLELSLENCSKLTSEGIYNFIGILPQSLRRLDLTNCALPSKPLPFPSGLTALVLNSSQEDLLITQLQGIPKDLEDLTIGPLTDRGGEALAKKSLRRLNRLNISGSTTLTNNPFLGIIKGCSNFYSLNLRNCRALNNCLDRLNGKLGNVEFLDLGGTSFEDAHIGAFVSRLPSTLKVLKLSNTAAGDKTVEQLTTRNYPVLESIDFSNCSSINDSCWHMLKSVQWPALNELHLKGTSISQFDFSDIPNSANLFLKIITFPDCCYRIDLTNCSQVEEAVFDRMSSLLPTGLEELVLSGCSGINDRVMREIAANLPQGMRKLELSHTNIMGDSLSRIRVPLQVLTLSYCKKLTDETVRAIGRLLKSIEEMDLSDCSQISDEAFTYLFSQSESKLERIDLSRTSFTKAQIAIIAQLRELKLSECKNLNNNTALEIATKAEKQGPFLDLTGCNLDLITSLHIQAKLQRRVALSQPANIHGVTIDDKCPWFKAELCPQLAEWLPKELVEFHFAPMQQIPLGSTRLLLSKLPSGLRRLTLKNTPVPVHSSWVVDLSNLSNLHLENTQLHQSHYIELIKGLTSNLQNLSITCDQLTDSDIAKIVDHLPKGLNVIEFCLPQFGETSTNVLTHLVTSLECFKLESREITDSQIIKLVKSLPSTLRRLQLENCPKLSEAFLTEFPIKQFSELKKFSLTGNSQLSVERVLEFSMQTQPGVVEFEIGTDNLELSFQDWKDEYFVHFAHWLPKTLKHLRLNHSLIGDRGLKSLKYKWPLSLETLDLRECTNVTDEGLLAIIDRLPTSLSSLYLWGMKLTDKSIVKLCENLPKSLTSLSLGNLPITDKSLEVLSRHLPKEIKILGLSQCRSITDHGISSLATELPQNMSSLDLGGTPITEEVFESLQYVSLDELSLDGCPHLNRSCLEEMCTHMRGKIGYLDLGKADLPVKNVLALRKAEIGTSGLIWKFTQQRFELDCSQLSVSELGLVLKWLPENLASLRLTNCTMMTDDLFKAFIAHLPEIEEIVIAHSGLTPSVFDILAESYPSQLRILTLTGRNLKKEDQLLRVLELAATRDDTSPTLLCALAIRLFDIGDRDEEAIELLKRGAASNDAESQYQLGIHYLLTENNQVIAKDWFELAMNQGHEAAKAQFELCMKNLQFIVTDLFNKLPDEEDDL